jgi:hypothetical protein
VVSNSVLQDLTKRIEVIGLKELFARSAQQVLVCEAARNESLDEVCKELGMREKRGGERK